MRSASPRWLRANTPPTRRVGMVAWALALLALLTLNAQAQAPATSPLPVKAAYVYKFADFVEWPAESFSEPNAPLNICVQGEDPFGPLLDRSIQGQQIEGHPLAVRRLTKVDRASPCHILFVGGGREQSASAALAAVRGAPMLTITDQARPGSRGIIDFELVRSMVRFSIDQAAAEAGRLTISSKLLSLAVNMRPPEARP